MKTYTAEVLYVDGQVERHKLGEEKIILGTASHADIAISGASEIDPEHLLLLPRPSGCWVSVARDVETQVMRNGVVVNNREVPWGAELDIGSITVRLCQGSSKSDGDEGTAMRVGKLIVAAVIAAVGLWMMQESGPSVPEAPNQAPELFANAPVECDVDAKQAGKRGIELMRAAYFYRQRFPFDAQEGIRSVATMHLASACFEAAGDKSMVAKMRALHDSYRDDLNEVYRVARLQLGEALRIKEKKSALRLVRELDNLLQHRRGDYTEWLGHVRRYLKEEA